MMSPRREAAEVASLRGESPRISVKRTRKALSRFEIRKELRELREAVGVNLRQFFHLEQNVPGWRRPRDSHCAEGSNMPRTRSIRSRVSVGSGCVPANSMGSSRSSSTASTRRRI